MAIAASLIGLQARRQLDENVKALFAETQERLVAMARVHGLLSKSETLQLIDPVELHPGSLRGAPSDRRY